MKIKREYVNFKELFKTDEQAKKIFYKAYEPILEECKDSIEEIVIRYALADRQMDWAIPHPGLLVDGFRKLDEEEPYENGFSFDDVKDIELHNKSEDNVELYLYTNYHQLVQVVDINKDNLKYVLK